MPYSAPAGTRVGHVHLKVGDLDRAIAFYRDVLGFEVTQRYGAQAAFLQVHSENEPALRLYERFGFTIAYPYWYRIAPERTF